MRLGPRTSGTVRSVAEIAHQKGATSDPVYPLSADGASSPESGAERVLIDPGEYTVLLPDSGEGFSLEIYCTTTTKNIETFGFQKDFDCFGDHPSTRKVVHIK